MKSVSQSIDPRVGGDCRQRTNAKETHLALALLAALALLLSCSVVLGVSGVVGGDGSPHAHTPTRPSTQRAHLLILVLALLVLALLVVGVLVWMGCGVMVVVACQSTTHEHVYTQTHTHTHATACSPPPPRRPPWPSSASSPRRRGRLNMYVCSACVGYGAQSVNQASATQHHARPHTCHKETRERTLVLLRHLLALVGVGLLLVLLVSWWCW